MSGIGAIFFKNKRAVSRNEINQLAQGLRPYGRAYHAIKALGPCGLAYAHAVNSPQSLFDRQPISNAAGVLHLIFDGRLDNRAELAHQLGLSTADAETWPDSRFALEAWERWGEAAPEHWEGEFATLVWNTSLQSLTAARDQLGDRALSYHETADRIVVASAPYSLFALADIPKEIDEQKLADALVQLFYDGARSFYKGITRIRPAHLLTSTSERTQIRRYWSLDQAAEIRLSSDHEYEEAASELLDRAIKACLRRVGPVGAFMTGGLDSSTVAVSTLPHLNDQEKLPTFTWIPRSDWDGRCRSGIYGDETPFVKAIVDMHPRLAPTFIRSQDHGLFHQLDEFLQYSGVAPRNAINLCWIHDIYLAAQDRGIGVLLGGGGGNLSLGWGGSGIFLEHLKKRAYLNLFKDLFAGKPSARIFAYRLLKMLLLPVAPDRVKSGYLKLRGLTSAMPLWHRCSAINPEFALAMNIDERLALYNFDYNMKPHSDIRSHRKKLLSDGLNNEKADLNQGFRALYGVEAREPLGNRRLIEWCVGLPESQFWRLGHSRWLVKRLMKKKLPSMVMSNTKVGEQVIDWHYRMTQDLPLIRQELEALADDPDTSRFIDIKRVRTFLDHWPSETPLIPRPGHTYSYVPVSIGAALAAGRFVRRTKGSNR